MPLHRLCGQCNKSLYYHEKINSYLLLTHNGPSPMRRYYCTRQCVLTHIGNMLDGRNAGSKMLIFVLKKPGEKTITEYRGNIQVQSQKPLAKK